MNKIVPLLALALLTVACHTKVVVPLTPEGRACFDACQRSIEPDYRECDRKWPDTDGCVHRMNAKLYSCLMDCPGACER